MRSLKKREVVRDMVALGALREICEAQHGTSNCMPLSVRHVVYRVLRFK